MRLPLKSVVFALVLVSPACGPSSAETATETATETDQGSGSTGTDTAATTTDTGGSCELPENASLGAETAVFTIRNERDVKIYVTPYSSFTCNYGKVEIDVGGEPVLWDHSGTYPYSCSESLCGWGCSDGGAMGFIINPGAVAQVEWGGGLWAEAALPAACKDMMSCANDPGDTCEVLELVDGEYTVRVNLSEECPVEDECGECTDGVCEVFFYEPGVGNNSGALEATAVFPAGVEIVVD